MKRKKAGKARAINYELILPGEEGREAEAYQILRAMRKHHVPIKDARIAMAWRLRWKADKDERLVLGMCRKVSDLNKELADFDFIILLNREVWESDEFTAAQKNALVDHELCHAAVVLDEKTRLPKLDERGRPCWRIRKHDLEEFRCIVERHGIWKNDLEAFARAIIEKADAPLFASSAKKLKVVRQ